MKFSPTQLRALEALETHKAYWSKFGRRNGQMDYAPRGVRHTTYNALIKAGLVHAVATLDRISVPAGRFGRTARCGYRSLSRSECSFEITDAGRAFLAARRAECAA